MRNQDLEPSSLPLLADLTDGEAGYREDLAGEEEPVPGVPPVPALKDRLLQGSGDSTAIVFADHDDAVG